MRSLIEYTSARMNENSRIILVEGLPCVGKSEFAKKLADNFKLKYIPPFTDDDVFVICGLDKRETDGLMPTERLKCYDMDSFYAGLDPQKKLFYGNTQINYFKQRWEQYLLALRHIMNTGQGVVLENSVYSDMVYALNMADHGYFTKKGLRWYMEHRENSLYLFWKPHLIIHLDAPSSYIEKKMKEKYPKLQNSPVLNEAYLDGWRKKYNEVYLPEMRQHCDTLYYDIREMEDLDLLFMDLEGMDLISARFGESTKFADWHKQKEEQWSMYRLTLESEHYIQHIDDWHGPWECPELAMDGEELTYLEYLFQFIPQYSYDPNYWYDKDGNFIPRELLKEVSPVTLASEDPTCNQGVPPTPKVTS